MPGEVPDPGRAQRGAGTCGSPGGCEPLSDPVFSSGDLPPTVGSPPPFQQFLLRSKDRRVIRDSWGHRLGKRPHVSGNFAVLGIDFPQGLLRTESSVSTGTRMVLLRQGVK